MKQSEDIRKRLEELARRSFEENRFTFTDFLDMAQLDVFASIKRDLAFARPEVYGGTPASERCMVRFGSESVLGYEQPFPIEVLMIEPQMAKFSEKLTHRDFLGSILGLGLERSRIGDLYVSDNCCAAFVHSDVAGYILDNLVTVRRTHVTAARCDSLPEKLTPKLERRSVNIPSCRLDALIAACFRLPREKAQTLVREGKVFVNGLNVLAGAKELKSGDVISVRGMGKLVFAGEEGRTRKDRICATVDIYV